MFNTVYKNVYIIYTLMYAMYIQSLLIFSSECISDLADSQTSRGAPLDDGNQFVHRFCAKLEHLLQYGLKCM